MIQTAKMIWTTIQITIRTMMKICSTTSVEAGVQVMLSYGVPSPDICVNLFYWHAWFDAKIWLAIVSL
jgi:hypothetical protein